MANTIKNPMILSPFDDAKKIKYAFFDADNTLWPWTTMRIAGVKAMIPVIYRWLKTMDKYSKTDEMDVKKNMGYVYSTYGSFDAPYLVENMPIVCEHLIKASKQFQDEEKGSMYSSIMLSRLLTDTLDAYRRAREKEYKPYTEIPKILEILQTRMSVYILTDAPLEKTIKRLHDMGLDKYIKGVYGRPQPTFDKLKTTQEIRKKWPKISEREMELLLKYQEVHGIAPRHSRSEKAEGAIEGVRFQVSQIFDRRKPDIDLRKLITLQKDESIDESVVFIGDNPKKDIMEAYNNGCAGILFKPGHPSQEERSFMKELNVDDETVGVNFPDITNLEKIDDSQWIHRSKKKEHSRRRKKLKHINHPIQILDRLKIKRP